MKRWMRTVGTGMMWGTLWMISIFYAIDFYRVLFPQTPAISQGSEAMHVLQDRMQEHNPDCSAGQYAVMIAANGDLICVVEGPTESFYPAVVWETARDGATWGTDGQLQPICPREHIPSVGTNERLFCCPVEYTIGMITGHEDLALCMQLSH